MRVTQPNGQRGSLKWIQTAVNERWPALDQPILDAIGPDREIVWRSPLASDNFAEYRDGSFLDLIGQSQLRPRLEQFWPKGGPQWDALGVSTRGDVLLVEAKAHVAELCSPASAASPTSLAIIKASLDATAERLGARLDRADWAKHFFQLGNRLAHLHFLQSCNVSAWLVLVNVIGDAEMNGPTCPEAWETAYQVAFHVMGLRANHPLSKYVVHVTLPALS